MVDLLMAKCFQVELVESPFGSTPAIWSQAIEGNADPAAICWKHLGYIACVSQTNFNSFGS